MRQAAWSGKVPLFSTGTNNIRYEDLRMIKMQIPTRKEIIAEARAGGGLVAAVLPFHYPRALLRAHGIHPVEVWGPPHVDDMAGSVHFPEYTCKIAQKATHFLSGPGAGAVDCILIPHTCDSLQGMASVMADFIRSEKPVFTLYHPRGRRQSDLVFLAEELRCLSGNLSRASGATPDDAGLWAAMSAEDEAFRVFSRMALARASYNVTDREFYTFLRSGEYLPPETFIRLAGEIPGGRPGLPGPGLMLSGIVADPLDLFDRINAYGAHVACDDLACCSRRIYSPVRGRAGDDPWLAMAEQLMSMPPDPTVSTPYQQRFDYLLARMEAANARGMLVYDVKFCEPELFYMPMLEEAVRSRGYGFLYVETELAPDIPHTVLNRINAFVEVIS